MYSFESKVDNRLNREFMGSLVKDLRERNASRYGLVSKVPYSPLIKGTTLYERKTALGYNLGTLTEGNTVLFTGQCLVKSDEDSECPVTLEDAIECERLKELLQQHPMPAVCMYPDSTYAEFIRGWSGEKTSQNDVDRATKQHMVFRKRILPEIVHYRTSELEEILPTDIDHLKSQITRIYGGRILEKGEKHPLQRTILQYGIKTVFLPMVAGHGERDIAVFAEPDEICSVKAAELVRDQMNRDVQIGLIGQLPLPSLKFPNGKVRMYSAGKKERIHLNEPDEQIRKRLHSNPSFVLLALQLSPLTTEDQLEHIGISKDRRIGTDLLMEQIKLFRAYIG